MLKFRNLKADEIEVRVAQVKQNGLSLLLYKDARCDMNILDESIGCLNWQREHYEVKGNLHCKVSIWDENKNQWISKSDVGVESNAEAQKGEASDSFKRACFNWGIGRELYTAPFIWVSSNNCNIQGNKCYDKFEVSHINYENNRITELVVVNAQTKAVVYSLKGNNTQSPMQNVQVQNVQASQNTYQKPNNTYNSTNSDDLSYGNQSQKPYQLSVKQLNWLDKECKMANMTKEQAIEKYNIKYNKSISLTNMQRSDFEALIDILKKVNAKNRA